MDVKSDLDTLVALTGAVAAGKIRRRLARETDTLIEDRLEDLDERLVAVGRAMDTGMAPLRDELGELIATTDGLFNHHSALAMMLSARRQTEAARDDVVAALSEVKGVGESDIPADLLAEGVVADFEAARGKELDPHLSAGSMLASSVRGPGIDGARSYLERMAKRRVWAIHGYVLSSVAAAEPSSAAASRDEVSALRAQAETQTRALRDQIHQRAKQLERDGSAGPSWAVGMWLALNAAETWITDQAPRLADACAAASTPDAAAELRRDAALAYDGVRVTLALAAGGWAALRAWATWDADLLARLAAAVSLQMGPGTFDLPRSSLAEAASAEEETVVEVADVITDAEITAGGPRPRTVLTLGPEGGTQLTVLVPFIAADSFGVRPGAWIQARGRMFPDGKDGLEGPLMMTRRIQGETAGDVSFLDHLTWEGRHQFELRPGGWDLVPGRLAGTEITVAELGLRE